MSMPISDAEDADAKDYATLTRIARTLGCSLDRFFRAAPTSRPRDTAQLIQLWLAIKTPEGRDAVFTFAGEVLRTEKSRSS